MIPEKIKKFFANKTVRIIAILVCALLLLLAVWKVFFRSDEAVSASDQYRATEQEQKLSLLLEKIEGVQRATVMIGEEDGECKSVVVIFEGEDAILTRLRITQVTASALSIKDSQILVYPSS